MSRSPRLAEALAMTERVRAEREARPPSFDDLFAEAAAIESGTGHAGSDYVEHVIDLVRKVALDRDFLTIDDVAPLVELPVVDRRALGGVMRTAASRGLIEGTGRYVKSERAERHRSPVALWKSLLYREVGA